MSNVSKSHTVRLFHNCNAQTHTAPCRNLLSRMPQYRCYTPECPPAIRRCTPPAQEENAIRQMYATVPKRHHAYMCTKQMKIYLCFCHLLQTNAALWLYAGTIRRYTLMYASSGFNPCFLPLYAQLYAAIRHMDANTKIHIAILS